MPKRERERPSIRDVEVRFPGEDRPRTGADLNIVLRAVLMDLQRENGWGSDAEAARALGVPQQTLSDFLNGKQGMTLDTLSKVCAATRQTPLKLLQRHERYAPEAAPGFAEDLVFDRFRAIIRDKGLASRILGLLEHLAQHGALEDTVAAAERILPTATLGPQKRTTTSRRTKSPRKR